MLLVANEEASTTTSRQWEKAKIGTSIPNISHTLVFIGLPLSIRL